MKMDENDWKLLFYKIFAFSNRSLAQNVKYDYLNSFSIENVPGVERITSEKLVLQYFPK